MPTDQERALAEAAEWVRSRPPEVRELIRRFPPTARVRTREGVRLMIPAPGVEGQVQSWYEDGTVGVVAPMARTVTSPITGQTAHEGEPIIGQCDPADLELVEGQEELLATIAGWLDS